jgi:phage major head subunit gpT-like protein
MILNRDTINALSRSLKALVFQAKEEYTPIWPKIALEVQSSTRANYYAWLENMPTMRLWEGERQVQNLTAQTFSIVNKDWEATFPVSRIDVEDDQMDLIRITALKYARRWAEHDDLLIAELLRKGFQEKGYDGRPFFGTHTVGRKTFQNGSNAPLTREAFRQALSQMRSLTDARGYPLGFFFQKPIYLVVGPALESTAYEIVGAPTLPTGGANPDYGKAEILLHPWLQEEYETYWFLIDGSQPIRPFVLQRRSRPEWVAKDDPETSDEVFKHNMFLYGVYERKAVGYLYWQLAYGSTGAGS